MEPKNILEITTRANFRNWLLENQSVGWLQRREKILRQTVYGI